MDNIPLINGAAYEWASITLVLFGMPISGITEINYSEKQDMQNNYGAGRNPVSRSYGKNEFSGDISLYKEEVVAIQKAVSSGRLQDIPEFDIVVTYLAGANITTETIKMCRFMENNVSVKEGDKNIPVKLPLIIGGIVWK